MIRCRFCSKHRVERGMQFSYPPIISVINLITLNSLYCNFFHFWPHIFYPLFCTFPFTYLPEMTNSPCEKKSMVIPFYKVIYGHSFYFLLFYHALHDVLEIEFTIVSSHHLSVLFPRNDQC